jgi:hypothetical protein
MKRFGKLNFDNHNLAKIGTFAFLPLYAKATKGEKSYIIFQVLTILNLGSL